MYIIINYNLNFVPVIRAQDNTKAVDDPAENEANDLSLLNKYNKLLKKLLNYGVPFFEGKKSREEIIKYFHDYPSTRKPARLDLKTTVNKTKENLPKDEDEIRKDFILISYKKYLENLIKYGAKVLTPNKEIMSKGSKREKSNRKGRTQYNDDDAEVYDRYLDKYKIQGSNPRKERYNY